MLIINRVSHHFDQQCVLDNISLKCEPGLITCLIGPSGCGKTTLLRLTAGLLQLQSGKISLDGQTLADSDQGRPPEQRPVGMVFQEGALFPHMSVADNVGFSLQPNARERRVAELLDQVGLSEFSTRYPDSLSGGQRQRVALARALAPSPRALLFDEPYANLDIGLRRTMREDARAMIRDTGTIGLFVTHDPDEVMAIGDHVVVLDRGQVVQQGEPQALYDQPTSLYVAQLFGDSQTLEATLDATGLHTPFGVWSRDCLIEPSMPDGPVSIVVHAHHLMLEPSDSGPIVVETRPFGAQDRLYVNAVDGNETLVAERPRNSAAAALSGVRVRVVPDSGSVFAAKKP